MFGVEGDGGDLAHVVGNFRVGEGKLADVGDRAFEEGGDAGGVEVGVCPVERGDAGGVKGAPTGGGPRFSR